MFHEKGVLKDFAEFTKNTCVGDSFLIKLQPATLLQKEALIQEVFLGILRNV